MRLAARQTQILNLLFHAKDTYLTSDMIANRIGVTNKTVQSDIALINDYLVDYPMKIDSERGKGYKIHYEEHAKIDQIINSFVEINEFNELDFQCSWVICYFILNRGYVTQREILDILFISHNQFKKVFKRVVNEIYRHKIMILSGTGSGYIFEGEEIYMRYCFIYNLKILRNSEYYLDLLRKTYNYNSDYPIGITKAMIRSELSKHDFIISDCNLDNLVEYIRFMKFRYNSKLDIRFTKIKFGLETELVSISERLLSIIGIMNGFEAKYLAATIKFLINESSLIPRLVMSEEDARTIQTINSFYSRRKDLFVNSFWSFDELQRNITNAILLIICKNSLGYREIETDLASFVPDDEFQVAIEYVVLLAFKIEADLGVEFFRDDIYRLATIINAYLKLDIWGEKVQVLVLSNSSFMKRKFLERKIRIAIPSVEILNEDQVCLSENQNRKLIVIADYVDSRFSKSKHVLFGHFVTLMQYNSIISFINEYYNYNSLTKERYLSLLSKENYSVIDATSRNEVVEFITEKYLCSIPRKATIQSNVFIRETRYFGVVFNGVAYPHIYVDSITKPCIEIIKLNREVLWNETPIQMVIAYMLPNSYTNLEVLGKPFFEISRNVNLVEQLKRTKSFSAFLLCLSKSLD